MVFFKACPKCHGDLYLDWDMYGAFVQCLQCGLLKDVRRQDVVRSRLLPVAEEGRRAA